MNSVPSISKCVQVVEKDRWCFCHAGSFNNDDFTVTKRNSDKELGIVCYFFETLKSVNIRKQGDIITIQHQSFFHFTTDSDSNASVGKSSMIMKDTLKLQKMYIYIYIYKHIHTIIHDTIQGKPNNKL